MKFYPAPALRYFFRYAFVILFVGVPLWLTTVLPDCVVEGDGEKAVFLCLFLTAYGMVMVHLLWDKMFAVLVVTKNDIRLECPFRKTKAIPASRCVEVGAYVENADKGVPTEQIYFSLSSNPQKNIGKNGVMKASSNLIKYPYSEELCNCIMETFTSTQCSALTVYRENRSRRY